MARTQLYACKRQQAPYCKDLPNDITFVLSISGSTFFTGGGGMPGGPGSGSAAGGGAALGGGSRGGGSRGPSLLDGGGRRSSLRMLCPWSLRLGGSRSRGRSLSRSLSLCISRSSLSSRRLCSSTGRPLWPCDDMMGSLKSKLASVGSVAARLGNATQRVIGGDGNGQSLGKVATPQKATSASL